MSSLDGLKKFLYNPRAVGCRLSSQEGVTQVSKYEIISLALSAGSFVLALLTYLK